MSTTLMELDLPRLGILLGLIAVVGTFITLIAIVGLVQWRKVKQSEMEAQLKLQMLDQGMTAGDIEQVVDAGKGRRRRDWGGLAHEWMSQKMKKKTC